MVFIGIGGPPKLKSNDHDGWGPKWGVVRGWGVGEGQGHSAMGPRACHGCEDPEEEDMKKWVNNAFGMSEC